MWALVMLLRSPVAPWAVAWALVLIGLSLTVRFRWSLIYASASVGLVVIASVAFLTYYSGVQDATGGFVIEGPEFFGIVLAVIGSTVFAGITLSVGALAALGKRLLMTAQVREVEQI
jgi:hypothetical protein